MKDAQDIYAELNGTQEWDDWSTEAQPEEPCQHPTPYAISLGRCAVVCAYCGETISDLNPQMPPVLRVKREKEAL